MRCAPFKFTAKCSCNSYFNLLIAHAAVHLCSLGIALVIATAKYAYDKANHQLILVMYGDRYIYAKLRCEYSYI